MLCQQSFGFFLFLVVPIDYVILGLDLLCTQPSGFCFLFLSFEGIEMLSVCLCCCLSQFRVLVFDFSKCRVLIALSTPRTVMQAFE